MITAEYFDEWVCETIGDYIIERLEIRTKGKKKPLVLNSPQYAQLIPNIMQYINCNKSQAAQVLINGIIETPDPDFERYIYAMNTIRKLSQKID
jgi:hypothetical protein